jgi:hypothetical protein
LRGAPATSTFAQPCGHADHGRSPPDGPVETTRAENGPSKQGSSDASGPGTGPALRERNFGVELVHGLSGAVTAAQSGAYGERISPQFIPAFLSVTSHGPWAEKFSGRGARQGCRRGRASAGRDWIDCPCQVQISSDRRRRPKSEMFLHSLGPVGSAERTRGRPRRSRLTAPFKVSLLRPAAGTVRSS